MSKHKSPIQKYRPYLTIQQLHYFLHLVESDTSEDTQLIRALTLKELKLFLVKYDLGAVKAASTVVGRESLEDKLGLGVSTDTDKASIREAAYLQWKKNPELCTPYQLEQAQLYRYENDLMTPEEEAAYEQSA